MDYINILFFFIFFKYYFLVRLLKSRLNRNKIIRIDGIAIREIVRDFLKRNLRN
jgi:hypothetical protein